MLPGLTHTFDCMLGRWAAQGRGLDLGCSTPPCGLRPTAQGGVVGSHGAMVRSFARYFEVDHGWIPSVLQILVNRFEELKHVLVHGAHLGKRELVVSLKPHVGVGRSNAHIKRWSSHTPSMFLCAHREAFGSFPRVQLDPQLVLALPAGERTASRGGLNLHESIAREDHICKHGQTLHESGSFVCTSVQRSAKVHPPEVSHIDDGSIEHLAVLEGRGAIHLQADMESLLAPW